MARPTARVLALLEILQTGGTHTAAELAARLGVDERTARRYVEHLVDLDVPVWAERGRYGGFRLAPGFRMPPLMLTHDEALAVLLGLVVAGRSGLVPSAGTATESAAAKVRRVLPQRLGARLEALLETVGFTAPSRRASQAETDVLLAVAEAARDRHAVAVTYRSADGRQSERIVEPYGVVAHSGRWYVTGADSGSGEERTFRLDRIGRLRPLPLPPSPFPTPVTRRSGCSPLWPRRRGDRPSRARPGRRARRRPACAASDWPWWRRLLRPTCRPPMVRGCDFGSRSSGWTGFLRCSPGSTGRSSSKSPPPSVTTCRRSPSGSSARRGSVDLTRVRELPRRVILRPGRGCRDSEAFAQRAVRASSSRPLPLAYRSASRRSSGTAAGLSRSRAP